MDINYIAGLFKNKKDAEFTKSVIDSVNASIWYMDLERDALWVSIENVKFKRVPMLFKMRKEELFYVRALLLILQSVKR
ncbi:hypothetical protein [Domibacillus iocasae]|uniref:Uncharacterized protein n=1 Tax=Domibacillus iocasae TaxID=1714016 RepID=A0A1E7DQY4_9BACI|nr:hypothetical protein [Domibacillus iocasae]OES45500.1 hypothetical protein BA724_01380 [Domibacillus iocasae]